MNYHLSCMCIIIMCALGECAEKGRQESYSYK